MATDTRKLPKIQREIDELKRKIDDLRGRDLPDLGVTSPERRVAYKKSTDLKADVFDLIYQVGQLSLKDERLPTAEFEAKKSQECRRLAAMKEQLEKISHQLEPDEMEEEYLSKFMDGQAPSVSDVNSVHDKEEDDGEYESDEDSIKIDKVEALSDVKGERPGDLVFKKGDILTILEVRDDGWWIGEDKDGNQGFVPRTLVKTTEEDVLKAMNVVPSGFRSSTLGSLIKNENHKTSFWLTPKLSPSNLAFKDLFWDPLDKKLQRRNVKLTRTFTLVGAKCIPPPGAGLEVQSRHVRIAFWDGKNIFGNVHTVRAVISGKDEQAWVFSPNVPGFLPSIYEKECIARINSSTENLALLFELNYSYVRSSTGEKGEFSIGWCSLPLFENDGSPIVNKNYELQLNGGTPHEKGKPVDNTLSLKRSQSLFQSVLRVNKQSRLNVKLTPINRVAKAQYDLLPDRLITCERHVKFITLYRELLAETYVKEDRLRGGFVCDPVLAAFCKVFDYSDLADSLMRDPAHMLSLFKQCFIESPFSIMQCSNFPYYVWANEDVEQERSKFIISFLEDKNSISKVFSPTTNFRPLNATRVSFDILSRNCLEVVGSDKL
eukprot:gene10068-11096_t